jgi:hypothetical protein
MVFLNAKNNLEKDAFLNFSQIARVGSDDKVNVLVEFGRPKNHYYSADANPWSGVRRFRVMKGMLPVAENAVQDLGEADMGVGQTLADFVVWSHCFYPAEHSMLVIWDHGQGWRLQLASSMTDRALAAHAQTFAADSSRSTIRPGTSSSPILGGIKSVSFDEDTGNILYNRDIQNSLTTVLKGAKLDVIGFDACLMSMLETAYAMRNVADVFIGSEEEEPGEGWNYEKWLAKLHLDSQANRADRLNVAADVVNAYEETYGSGPTGTTLSALDLANIKHIADSLGMFAASATRAWAGHFRAFKKARVACASYGAHSAVKTSVDLIRLLESLSNTLSDPALLASVSNLQQSIRQSVLNSYASTDMKPGYGSTGIAIYFPASAADFNNDPNKSGYDRDNTIFPIEFVNDEAWTDLVHAYVKSDSSRGSMIRRTNRR